MTAGLFFFAEDVFGGQFAVTDDRVVTFDPETGVIVEIASSLEGWANVLLADPEFYTGSLLLTNGNSDIARCAMMSG
jgi:hypothetical protein